MDSLVECCSHQCSRLRRANGVLHAAEAMRLGRDAFPGCDGFYDAFLCVFDAH